MINSNFYPLPLTDYLMPLIIGAIVGYAAYKLALTGIFTQIDDDKSYANWLKEKFEILFLNISLTSCRFIPIFSAIIALAMGFVLVGFSSLISLIPLLVFLWLGWNLPRMLVKILINRRIKQVDSQFVAALDMMSNSLKSGLSFQQVLELVHKESPKPIAQEFGLMVSQHRLGVNLDKALEKFSQRMPSDDINMAINSILILREMGGNLTETFDTIAMTIRQRKKVEAKIKAFTAQGVTQTAILSFFPYGMLIFFYLFSPGYLTPLFNHPLGYLILLMMVGLQAIGVIWMKKIVTIDV